MAVIAGLLLLIGGSKVLLMGAVGIAEHLGVSEAVIGLTLVASFYLGGVGNPEDVVATSPRLRRVADMLYQRAAPTDSLRIEVLARDGWPERMLAELEERGVHYEYLREEG